MSITKVKFLHKVPKKIEKCKQHENKRNHTPGNSQHVSMMQESYKVFSERLSNELFRFIVIIRCNLRIFSYGYHTGRHALWSRTQGYCCGSKLSLRRERLPMHCRVFWSMTQKSAREILTTAFKQNKKSKSKPISNPIQKAMRRTSCH